MSSEIRDRARRRIGEMLYNRKLGVDINREVTWIIDGEFYVEADQILSIKELAVVDVEGELPALTYEEYIAIHSAWANSKETVENLLRRITLETCYKVRKEGWVKNEGQDRQTG